MDLFLILQSAQNDQFSTTSLSHTLAEFENMLPCPIANCLWYSHSATLYDHLLSVSFVLIFVLIVKMIHIKICKIYNFLLITGF